MTEAQKGFLQAACVAARKADHIFPEMAACEAALESNYGRSQLATQDNNLFGMKQHRHAIFGSHILPTREFQGGEWVTISAVWIHYPDWASCFHDRMATLLRLSSVFPHYAAALHSASGVTYVNEVSKTWSTDPERAGKVLAIYDAMAGNWRAPLVIAPDLDGEISV